MVFKHDCRNQFQLIAFAFAQAYVAFFPARHWRLKTLKPVPFSRTPHTLGEHLIKRRAEFKLLQREAAERIGADVFSLINWEQGHHEPAIRFWPGIIAFLGYDPSPEPVTMGEHIKAERRRRGCGIAALAREFGFDQETLVGIETDTYPRIDPRVRVAYAALLDRYGLAEACEATASSVHIEKEARPKPRLKSILLGKHDG